MSSDTAVNWPLFLFTTLLVCLRSFASSICSWWLNRFHSPSDAIDRLTAELKRVSNELASLSQVDEFAAYTRKERQRNALVQRLKDERAGIECKQKNLLSCVRWALNIGTLLMILLLTVTGYRHQSMPLFDFPFFRFPLIVWMLALNTVVGTLSNVYMRYRTSEKSATTPNVQFIEEK